MMGFDPDRTADESSARRGFGDPTVEIIGEVSVTKFRPAIARLWRKDRARVSNLLALAGHTRNGAPS
jgi:hypothetical protein